MPGDRNERAYSVLQIASTAAESIQLAIFAPEVRCSDCKRAIPRAAALNPETGRAALYFCGRSCFRQWLTTHEWKMGQPRR